MPFHDLHLVYHNNDPDTSRALAFLAELDYSVVALTIGVPSKLPAQLPTVSVERLNVPASISLLSRLTLTVSDNAQNHRINALTSTYDIVALRPTDDKTFQLCCSSLECDIISLDLSQRLPFAIKFKTVASALQRGIRFEVCYSHGITGGNDARRNLISGAAALIRATRGKGIILSSEAKNALGLRGPWDVINLAQVWGLSQERGKEAICEEAERVVRLAGIKRTSFRGVVDFVNDGSKEMAAAPNSVEAVASSVEDKDLASAPMLDLPLVSVVPSKTPNPDKAKRKASLMSLNEDQNAPALPTQTHDGKPLSKREQKRQAKKARRERAAGKVEGSQHPPGEKTKANASANGFPIQHEQLLNKKTS